MAKNKLTYAVSAAALMCGVGIFMPGFAQNVSAYTIDSDGFAVPEGETDASRYDDLQAAIKANDKIRLNSDIVHYVKAAKVPSLAIDHSITLDLNGHILSTASTSGGAGGNTTMAVTGEGTVLTIQDSSDSKTGALRYDHKGNASPEMLRIEAGAKTILESGNIYTPYGRYGEGIGINLKGDGATFEMKGGKILTHEESTHSMNYGVDANANGSVFKMTGGEIKTSGPALYIPSGRAASIDISGDAALDTTGTKALDFSSTTATGTVSGITVKSVSTNSAIKFDNVVITDGLEVKGGENTLSNITVKGETKITSGTTTIGDGAKLEGGVVYTSSATASLTINDGAVINGFEQQGKEAKVSYTDKDTKEKVSVAYNTYGALTINGGTFEGNFKTASKEDVQAANDARKKYVDDYNEHSGKTAITYKDVAVTPEIKGGNYTTEPDVSVVKEGYEPDENEEGTGYAIYPIQIDMQENGEMQSDDTKAGAVAGSATFTKEFIADRKAEFEISTLDDDEFEGLKLSEKGGNLVAGFDVSLWDRDGNQISVKDTELKVRIELNESQYQALAAFDRVVAINFDKQGKEVERFDATLINEDGKYYAEFTTTHLSTYVLAGVDGEKTAEDMTEESGAVAAPETGTMTAAGASAVNAALVTSVAVGLLVSIVSFAYLIRKK